MDRFIGIGGILVLMFLGVIHIVRKIIVVNEDHKFSTNFIDNYNKFFAELLTEGINYKAYQWLRMNSFEMQTKMGTLGVLQYKPYGSNYSHNNYQVIVNGLTEIKQIYKGPINQYSTNFDRDELKFTQMVINEPLLTYIGYLENKRSAYVESLKNPIIWFREGIQLVVAFPVYLLCFAGVIASETYNKWSSSKLVNLLSLLIGVATLGGTIITIVTGYSSFIEIVSDLF